MGNSGQRDLELDGLSQEFGGWKFSRDRGQIVAVRREGGAPALRAGSAAVLRMHLSHAAHRQVMSQVAARHV
jgi:hypothetical protein